MGRFQGWGGAALVTGASSGIGRELARRFAARGVDVVLAARSGERLRELANELERSSGIAAVPVEVDLAGASGPDVLTRRVAELGKPIDVLVNNAGFGVYGAFGRRPTRESEMIRLNVSTPTALAGHFLPGMRARNCGLILNVASTAAFASMPGAACYAATKAYVVSWTRALDYELRGTGVRATVLCPGSTSTGFRAAAGATADRRGRLPRQQSAAEVAEECLRGVDRGRRVIVTGRWNRLQVLGTSMLPSSLVLRVASRAMAARSSEREAVGPSTGGGEG